jgi:hypothetical protein
MVWHNTKVLIYIGLLTAASTVMHLVKMLATQTFDLSQLETPAALLLVWTALYLLGEDEPE